MRTLGSLFVALLLQAQGGAVPESSGTRHHRLVARSSLVSQGRSADPRRCSRSISWGIILYKLWTFRRSARQTGAVSRRLPPQQQVLRSAGGLPVARRQPARRTVSGRLRRADGAAAADRASDRATSPNPAAAGAASNSQEPHGRRSRAAARVGGRGQQARAADSVSRDDGEHRAVHRTVRHGLGHHDRVPGHRPDRLDQSGGRGARHRRGARSRRRPACSRRFRRSTSTTTCRTA